MSKTPAFSDTYLYKIHALSAALDKAFDMVLCAHADITLSQFMVLMAISEHTTVNQRKVAQYLSLSAVAIKRQVDIAEYKDWIVKMPDDSIRGERLCLTHQGEVAMRKGLRALERHMFQIFDDHNRSANLMQHIDTLLGGVQEVIAKETRPQHITKKELHYANS